MNFRATHIFREAAKKFPPPKKKLWPLSSRGGDKALMAGPLKKLFISASLTNHEKVSWYILHAKNYATKNTKIMVYDSC